MWQSGRECLMAEGLGGRLFRLCVCGGSTASWPTCTGDVVEWQGLWWQGCSNNARCCCSDKGQGAIEWPLGMPKVHGVRSTASRPAGAGVRHRQQSVGGMHVCICVCAGTCPSCGLDTEKRLKTGMLARSLLTPHRLAAQALQSPCKLFPPRKADSVAAPHYP